MSNLRDLFRDTDAVKIYPDDFRIGNTTEKNILFPDLIDRRKGHFSDKRLAVLFRPGTYKDINFPVGYWTQVLGLGETPDEVEFTGRLGVYALPANTDNPDVGSLDTFWRSAENFQTNTSFVPNENGEYCVPTIHDENISSLIPSRGGKFENLYPLPDLRDQAPEYDPSKGMLWAVSQAAPLRRIQLADKGNLHLSLGNNCASGGFVGNLNIGGYLMMGSQQQFMVRNCDVSKKVFGGAWSMVFNGCTTDAQDLSKQCTQNISWLGTFPLVSSEPTTDVRVEKPFIFIGKRDAKVYLAVPQLQTNSTGSDVESPVFRYEIDDMKGKVRVFTPHDTHQDVQDAVSSGCHIVLSPGIYNWGETLEVSSSNQVILGLGLATIQAPGNGRACIHVSSKALGVRLSGLSLEASVISKFIYEGSTLLEWGEKDAKSSGSASNPGSIHDLYCFVGGRSPDRTVQVQTMVKIFSDHVVGDNLWLWRADHVRLMNDLEKPNRPELSEYHITTFGECRCDTGLEVYGDNVTFYGLAIEHTYKDMLIWYGRHGTVNFYQSELPYDVPGSAYSGIAGYRVHHSASNHRAKGVGIYSYFRDFDDVVCESALVHHAPDGKYENVFTVWLNGWSGIKSIINGFGNNTSMPGRPFVVTSYRSQGMLSKHFWIGLWKTFFSK